MQKQHPLGRYQVISQSFDVPTDELYSNWLGFRVGQAKSNNKQQQKNMPLILPLLPYYSWRKGEGKRVKYGTYILWKGWQTTHTKMGLLFRR